MWLGWQPERAPCPGCVCRRAARTGGIITAAFAIGAALLGGLGAMMTPVASASASGFGLLIIGVLLLLVLVELRRFRQTPPQVTASDS